MLKFFDSSLTGSGKFHKAVTDPVNLVMLILLVILAYLVIWPFIQLLIETLTWGDRDRRISPDAVPGEFTSFYWQQATSGPLSRKMLYGPLLNTLITGVTATIMALLAGGVLAWCVVRSDMPGKRWLQPVLTLPYIVPSFAIALAWEAVFRSPKVGGQPGIYEALLGVGPPEWLSYGAFPISITLAIHYFPFAYLLVAGALATIDSCLLVGNFCICQHLQCPYVLPSNP